MTPTDADVKKHKWWHWFWVNSDIQWGFVKGYGGGLREFNHCRKCNLKWETGDL